MKTKNEEKTSIKSNKSIWSMWLNQLQKKYMKNINIKQYDNPNIIKSYEKWHEWEWLEVQTEGKEEDEDDDRDDKDDDEDDELKK